MNFNDKFKVVCENVWLPHFFEMVVSCVCSDGGDGTGAVISDDYKYLADQFEEWLKEDKKIKYNIGRYDSKIVFGDNCNESITFTADKNSNGWFGTYVFRIEKLVKELSKLPDGLPTEIDPTVTDEDLNNSLLIHCRNSYEQSGELSNVDKQPEIKYSEEDITRVKYNVI